MVAEVVHPTGLWAGSWVLQWQESLQTRYQMNQSHRKRDHSLLLIRCLYQVVVVQTRVYGAAAVAVVVWMGRWLEESRDMALILRHQTPTRQSQNTGQLLLPLKLYHRRW